MNSPLSSAAFSGRTLPKIRLRWAFALLALIAGAVILFNSGRAHAESLGFSLNASAAAGAAASDLSVLVLDDATGAAVTDAVVSVGDSLQDEGTTAVRGKTGAQGQLLAKGALSRGPRSLTVSKDGFAAISIAGLDSPQVTVYLKTLPSAAGLSAGPTVIASGEAANWPGAGDGENVIAGIALQSLSALDLIHFNVDSFMSPLKDTIDVMGSHDIPSNFMIPDQDISVFFASIHVSKPSYRLPIVRGKTVHLASIQGSIAVGDIVSLAQSGGKPTMDLLNKLTITHAGLSAPVVADRDFSQRLDANHELSPRHQVTPGAPPFTADVLVAAMTDMDGSRTVMLPTDIKLAASSNDPSRVHTVSLSGPDSSVGVSRAVLTVAMAGRGHRISGIISDRVGSDVSPGEYLPQDELTDAVTVPDLVALQPIATGLAAAVYEAQGAAVWYVYALPGAGVSQFPSSRLPAPAKITSYSVMKLDFGQSFDTRTLDGQKIMTQLQRFGRSTAKIGQPDPQPF